MSGQVLNPSSGVATDSGPAGTSPLDQGTPPEVTAATAQSPSDQVQDSQLRREYTQARQTVTSVARTLGLPPGATQRDILNAIAKATTPSDEEPLSDRERERLEHIEEREWAAEIRNYGPIGEAARNAYDSIRFQQLTPAEFMVTFHGAVEAAVEQRIAEMQGQQQPAAVAQAPTAGQPQIPSADFAGARSVGGAPPEANLDDLRHSGDVRSAMRRIREAAGLTG